MKEQEQPLAFQIKELNNQIKNLFDRSSPVQLNTRLTHNQIIVLQYLKKYDESVGIYQKEIETEFNIRRSTASEMLKVMEKKGLIRRTTDAEDTRQKKIYMTEKAKEIDKIAREHVAWANERLTEGISEDELQQFKKTMRKIYNNAQ